MVDSFEKLPVKIYPDLKAGKAWLFLDEIEIN
jgi:hypothetical protein